MSCHFFLFFLDHTIIHHNCHLHCSVGDSGVVVVVIVTRRRSRQNEMEMSSFPLSQPKPLHLRHYHWIHSRPLFQHQIHSLQHLHNRRIYPYHHYVDQRGKDNPLIVIHHSLIPTPTQSEDLPLQPLCRSKRYRQPPDRYSP